MKNKEQITVMMLAVLAELKDFTITDIIVNKPLLYHSLTTQLRTYCEILDEDIPKDYIEQIEEYTEI